MKCKNCNHTLRFYDRWEHVDGKLHDSSITRDGRSCNCKEVVI